MSGSKDILIAELRERAEKAERFNAYLLGEMGKLAAERDELLSALARYLPDEGECAELRETFATDETIDDIKEIVEPMLDAVDTLRNHAAEVRKTLPELLDEARAERASLPASVLELSARNKALARAVCPGCGGTGVDTCCIISGLGGDESAYNPACSVCGGIGEVQP